MAEPQQILEPAPSSGARMTLIEHLQELRSRLIRVLLAFTVAGVAAWFFYDQILTFLIGPLARLPEASELIENGHLIVTAPQESFFIRLKVTAFTGLLISMPVIFWQMWRFVAPGLYGNEKRYALPFVLVSSVLFLAGAALAFAILPQALRILAGFGGEEIVLVPRASEYLSFLLLLVVAFGATFELPLLLISLTLVGVISSRSLRRGRRIAWLLILVAAAILTPTPDPINQLILAVPLALLYEGTVLAARLLRR